MNTASQRGDIVMILKPRKPRILLASLLMAVSLASCGRSDQNWDEDHARSDLRVLVEYLIVLESRTELPLPSTWDEFKDRLRQGKIILQDEHLPQTDGWGNRYRIEVASSQAEGDVTSDLRFTFRSLGPDRTAHTADDLTATVVLPCRNGNAKK